MSFTPVGCLNVWTHARRRSTGKAKRVMPAPPPLPASQRQASLRRGASNVGGAEPREDQVRIKQRKEKTIRSTLLFFFLPNSVIIITHVRALARSRINRLCLYICMQVCPICLTNVKDLAFGCGHMVRANSDRVPNTKTANLSGKNQGTY
jgi:E3 ubiquitin-protein ligase RGLG